MKTYIIIIPDCPHPYARYDFEAAEWWSTNDLSKTWTIDETTATDAADRFRETFGIDQGSFTITATLLSEAIEDREAYFLSVLTYFQKDKSIVIESRDAETTGELIIPSTINGLPVTELHNWAFYECTGLTSVTIPSSITDIGRGAFYGCTRLKAITVDGANSTYSSNDGILFNKAQTLLIAFPAGKIGAYTIPNSITEIGYAAFFRCKGLKSVTIPNSVTAIGEAAFYGCKGLKSVTLPSSLTEIGDYAFQRCTGLSSVTIPSSVTKIGQCAFQGCSSLTNVTLPSSVIEIGYGMFPNHTVATRV